MRQNKEIYSHISMKIGRVGTTAYCAMQQLTGRFDHYSVIQAQAAPETL